jgi:hypothetical protein
VLEPALVLSGNERDHATSLSFVGVLSKHLGHGGDEARVGVSQHEQQLGRALQARVGNTRVVQRPVHQLLDEIMLERREGGAFCAREHHHDRRSVRQAVVQQLAAERVILGCGTQLAHVFGRAQSSYSRPRALHQLLDQLGPNGGVEQLLFAAEIFIQVANRGVGPRRHVCHRGGGVAQLRERVGRRGHESLANLGLSDLDHLKEN